MDAYWTRNEQEIYVQRMEDEHHRQNRRIDILEKSFDENHKLLVAVEKLATNMEMMQKVQKEQNERLDKIESRDGESWRKVTGYIITAVLGLLVGFIFKQIGM